MFAVLKTGGKQYKVQSGDMLRVEKLAADAGETIQFNEILMLGGDAPGIGAHFVADDAVQAEVIDQVKGDKVINFVKRRRKHSSQRTKGHRQKLTLVRVTEILNSGADKSGVKAALGPVLLARLPLRRLLSLHPRRKRPNQPQRKPPKPNRQHQKPVRRLRAVI